MNNNLSNCSGSCCSCPISNEDSIAVQGPQGERGPEGLQGPRGERGPQGERGPRGDQGVQGVAGPRGSAGPQGPVGPQGVRGDAGPKGDPGYMGPQGIPGIQGPMGPQGNRGPVGPQGIPGPAGPAGPKGDRGEQGERGPAGEQGPMGEQGPQGEIGPQGTQGDAGCPGPQGDQGPMGPTGLKGNTGATGAAPAIAIGNVSSGLIPEVTADQADTGITLNFILPIGPTGPQGDQGIQGEQGPQGAMGNTGPKGDTGAVPIVTVGTVISGSNADVKAISTEDGVSLDFTLPAGPTGPAGEKGDAGPQGEPGDTGPRGLTGASPTIGVGGVTSGDNPEVTADPTAAGIELNFVLPVGPAGPQGEKGDPGEQGPQGNQGDTGPQGPVGAVPTVEVGTVSSGNDADVKANPTENGVTLDFVLPIGPVGPKGDQGLIGETGPQGEKGITGPTGATGPAPEISVSEDTAMSYKLSFKSGQQEIVSSNLRQAIEYHNADLSTTGRTLNVTIGKLVLIYAYVNTSSISIAIRPANLSQSVLADIRRTSIYDSASIESQTNNDTKVSASLTLDGTVYSQSQETHWMRIRQQDPDSGLWSMCEVTSFISARGARTSVCVEWLYTDCSF